MNHGHTLDVARLSGLTSRRAWSDSEVVRRWRAMLGNVPMAIALTAAAAVAWRSGPLTVGRVQPEGADQYSS
jgi:hypothetical protein